MQYNLFIMDIMGLFISILIISMYLVIQVSLQVHAKAHFGTTTKCVDYAGVLILIKRIQHTNICRVMHNSFSFSK